LVAGFHRDFRLNDGVRSVVAVVLFLLALASLAVAPPAYAQFNNTTPRADFAGHHNYQVTGGSLRRLPNGTSNDQDDDNNGTKDACEIVAGGSDTATLSGIPTDGNATIAAAYLYWGGSGSTVDSTVRLNGVSAPVLQTFTENFNGAGYDLDYFGGVADVTSIVQAAGGNGSYTFSGLTVDTGGGGGTTDPCAPSAVVAGWALFVFYSDPDEPYRYTRIYDGLQYFRDATVTTNQSGFRVPNFKDGKVTVVTWEGDPDAASSVPGDSGSTESLNFGTTFRTGALPDPANGCLTNGTLYASKISNNITGLCDSSKPGVDISTFDVTGFLDEGVDSASLVYSSGNDLVFLTAQVISTTNTPVIDLSIDKSHSGDFTVGSMGSYSIVVHNDGPEVAVGDNTVVPAQYTTVTDTLPAGLVYASASGTGWSCSAAGQVVTCVNQADIPANASLPALTLNVNVNSAGSGTVANTAVVSHPMFDSNPANNTDTDTATVIDPNGPVSGNKRLYLLMGQPDASHAMTRNVPTANGTMAWNSNNDNQYQYFYLPALSKALSLNSATVPVLLRGYRAGTGNRTVSARLYRNGTGNGNLVSNTASIVFNSGTYSDKSANLTLTTTSFQAGDQLILRLQNGSGNDVTLTQRDGTSYSYLTLDAATVINVDSVGFFSAPYTDPNPLQSKATWEPGDTVYIRADISDPFGGFDVSAANTKLTLADADGGPLILNGVAMTPRTSPAEGDGVPNRILEYAYTLPASPSLGTWTATVTASEGAEDTVHHSRPGSFTVTRKSLAVTKSHTGDFTAGANGSYTLTVANPGAAVAGGTTTTVQDTLATGLTFVSGTGPGWTCNAAAQVVTCTSTAAIAAGANMAPITLTVAVAGSVGASVANQASVANSSINGGAKKAGNIDTAVVHHADLSTSTKSVVDLNGGDVAPGDTLRYTITLTESAGTAAADVSVTDALPANTTALAVVSKPAGSTDASTASQLSITGIAVPANGSVAVVFDVVVGSVSAGTTIDNTAAIANPGGPGANPVAPTKVVLQSRIVEPADGTKVLYLYDNLGMTRVQTPASTTAGIQVANNGTADFTLSPALAKDLVLTSPGQSVNVTLRIKSNCTFLCNYLYPILSVELRYGGTSIGTSATQNVTSTTVAGVGFSIPLNAASPITIPSGTPLVLRVRNAGYAAAQFYQYNGGRSTASFFTTTVINVDGVEVHSQPYPSTATKAQYVQGDTMYVRAVVSDPFGAADITAAKLTLSDGASNILVDAAAMPERTAAATASAKTFETAYTVPDNPRIGSWTARVVAVEGTEVDGSGNPEITHEGTAFATVHGWATLGKAWSGATEGDAVALTIAGGSATVAGASTAPSTTTPATASFAPGATLTFTEAFTSGLAGHYSPALACTRSKDGAAVAVTGTGLSRSVVVPDDSAIACVWSNTWTTPLTVVKLSRTISDPIDGTNHPKAIPGAIVEYEIIVTNPATNPVDADSIFLIDAIPPQLEMVVADYGAGPGPVAFVDGPASGAPPSGLTYAYPADIAFSNDGGATWGYSPVPSGDDGVDAAVDAIRINPKGAFNADNAQFRIRLRAKVR
jgi:uncharacterized repeat protein (TIGR01451 family)